MLKLITLERKITLEPEYLDCNFKRHVWDKIVKVCLNTVNKDTGHIVGIRKIMKIMDNKISNVNSEIIFTVKFKADVLKPEAGKIFEGVVHIIFGSGIFVSIQDKFQVLIPEYKLRDKYTLNIVDKIFENKEDPSDNIECKQIRSVKIIDLRFTKQNFQCVGELV